MYSFIKVCGYLENLISIQTLLLFDYTGSAMKGDRKIVPRTISPPEDCPQQIPPVSGFELGLGLGAISWRRGNLPGGNFPSNALKNTDK